MYNSTAGYSSPEYHGAQLGQCEAPRPVNPSIQGTAEACHEVAMRVAMRFVNLNSRFECKPPPVNGKVERCQMGIMSTLSTTHQLLCAFEKELSEFETRIFG